MCPHTGRHWRCDCVVAGVGTLAGQSDGSSNLRSDDPHNHRYALHQSLLIQTAFTHVFSVAGVISDVQYACGPVPSDIYSEIGLESTTDASSRLALGSGTDISGLLSMAVSILTNGIATALISYRAW